MPLNWVIFMFFFLIVLYSEYSLIQLAVWLSWWPTLLLKSIFSLWGWYVSLLTPSWMVGLSSIFIRSYCLELSMRFDFKLWFYLNSFDRASNHRHKFIQFSHFYYLFALQLFSYNNVNKGGSVTKILVE